MNNNDFLLILIIKEGKPNKILYLYFDWAKERNQLEFIYLLDRSIVNELVRLAQLKYHDKNRYRFNI